MTTLRVRQILILIWPLLCLGFSCSRDVKRTKTQTVVRVNEHEMDSSTFAENLAHRLKRFDAVGAKNPSAIQAAKEALIEEFIHSSIVKDWAKENKVSVSSEDLNTAIDEYRKQYPSDLALKQALNDEGISYSNWKSGLEDIILQKKVFSYLKSRSPEPTEEDLRSYYNSNKEQFSQKAMIRLRQVVLEKQDDAERLFSSIGKTTKLEDLARKFSTAPESKNGGDTGWIAKGTLDIFDQAFAWPIGKRSSVLKSPYGYHILEVIDKKPEMQLNFEQARSSIQKLMQADREQAAYSGWLEEQIKKSHVFRNDELINSVSVTTTGEK